MPKPKKKKKSVSPIYTFAITWLILSLIIPLYKIWGLLITAGLCCFTAFIAGRISAKRSAREEAEEQQVKQAEEKQAPPEKKSYGPEIDPILEEGNRALSEMGRLYMSIKDVEVRQKINEIMRITDKITQDAINDPSDIPQIKKFMNYYLPTTIKLLNAYDRMDNLGVSGANIDASKGRVEQMLTTVEKAYDKQLDALFQDEAMDISADVTVLEQMMAQEGLTDNGQTL